MVIDGSNGCNLSRRAGEKQLIAYVQSLMKDIYLVNRNAHVSRNVNDGVSRDTGENTQRSRCGVNFAVFDHE